MKNYKELNNLKVCYYCQWIKTIEDESYCNHPSVRDTYNFIEPTGTCDNWIEEHIGN